MGYKEDRGPESNESSKETDTLDSLNIGAIKSSEGTDGYVLGHVVRMRKKGAKRGYVEYYRPFDIDGSEGNEVEIWFTKYDHTDDAYTLSVLRKVFIKSLLCSVEMTLENSKHYLDASQRDKVLLKLLQKRTTQTTLKKQEKTQGMNLRPCISLWTIFSILLTAHIVVT